MTRGDMKPHCSSNPPGQFPRMGPARSPTTIFYAAGPNIYILPQLPSYPKPVFNKAKSFALDKGKRLKKTTRRRSENDEKTAKGHIPDCTHHDAGHTGLGRGTVSGPAH